MRQLVRLSGAMAHAWPTDPALNLGACAPGSRRLRSDLWADHRTVRRAPGADSSLVANVAARQGNLMADGS